MKALYQVQDVKAGVYHHPIAMVSDGEAHRAFAQAANNKETQIGLTPEDFRIWKIGTHDESTGEIIIFPEKILLTEARVLVM